MMARLTRFVRPGPGELHPVRSEPEPTTSAANPWPELDIVSDTFISKGHDLGKLELVAKPADPIGESSDSRSRMTMGASTPMAGGGCVASGSRRNSM
jgi:hypothetical protein